MVCHPCLPALWSRCFCALLLSSALLLGVLRGSSEAQITLDGSLGPRGPLTGPHYRIGAELGQLRGGNLFHSFNEFNVPTGGSATFTGPNTIANILSRVTGGQPSAIDGVLRSEIAGANLFLLNPAGVLFGPNATLAVSGSFHVSTADFLRLADGAKFFADLGQESMLTVASPTAFGFLGDDPAAITIRGGSLQVPDGKAVSAVGGDVQIMGGALSAPRGRIQLASVASPGEAVFSPLELAPDLQLASFTRLGRLTLAQGALVDASGNGGGTVLLRGGQLRVDRSNLFADNTGPVDGTGLGMELQIAADAVLANGSRITVESLGGGRAGDVRLTAGRLHVDAAVIGSGTSASGHGGNVTVQGGQLTLTNGAQIRSSTFGPAKAGAVTVQAEQLVLAGAGASRIAGIVSVAEAGSTGDTGAVVVRADRLVIDGLEAPGVMGIGALVNPGSRGNAADTRVLARDLEVRNGGFISSSTFGSGAAGAVTVQAERVVLAGVSAASIPGLPPAPSVIASAALRGLGEVPGAAGAVHVTAGTLELRPGGVISSHTTGLGDAGLITVEADRLLIDGGETPLFTAIASTAGSGLDIGGAFGAAGSIRVTAGELEIRGGGAITSATFATGNAGTVTVQAHRLVITGRSTFVPPGAEAPFPSRIESSAEPGATGAGGAVHISAHTLVLADRGTIAARSFSPRGNAGDITLRVDGTLELHAGAVISTEASHADGGNLSLTAQGRVRLQDSAITASVGGGRTTVGGNLTLSAPWVILEGGRLIANAFEGRGGRIQIDARAVLADPASRIEASSERGIMGIVDIRAPVTSLSGTLAPLPQAFVNVAALLPARCAARAQDGRYSSLVLGGREGLPLDPGGLLPSPLTLDERLVADPVGTAGPHQPPSPTKFAFLTSADKAFPRLRGDPWAGRCPNAW